MVFFFLSSSCVICALSLHKTIVFPFEKQITHKQKNCLVNLKGASSLSFQCFQSLQTRLQAAAIVILCNVYYSVFADLGPFQGKSRIKVFQMHTPHMYTQNTMKPHTCRSIGILVHRPRGQDCAADIPSLNTLRHQSEEGIQSDTSDLIFFLQFLHMGFSLSVMQIQVNVCVDGQVKSDALPLPTQPVETLCRGRLC